MGGSIVQFDQEILIATAPTGARLILGSRGALAGDLAGLSVTNPVLVPTRLNVALDPLEAGLWVWCGSLGCDDGGRLFVVSGNTRPAILGDLQRFGIPPLLPRVEEVTAC